MRLVVVLPTYNEAENLEPMLQALLSLRLEGVRLAVPVVDDNSPDGTGRIADRVAVEHAGRVEVLHRPGKQGLGRAYVAGFRRALEQGVDLIVQMDCDFSHDPAAIPVLLAASGEADMVAGSRFLAGGSIDPHWAWWRKLLSRFANNVYVRAVPGLDLADATGGFRLWKRATLEGMDFGRRVLSNGYVFQVEMATVARRLGYRIREVPIHFRERGAGSSKMTLGVQAEAALRICQVRWRHRSLRPEMRA